MAKQNNDYSFRRDIGSRIADDYADSRRSKRKIDEIREQGREDRRNRSYDANITLRNKVADIMLEDEDTRRALVEGAKETASLGKTIIKGAGITILIGVGGFAVYKIVSLILNKYAQNSELNSQTRNLNTGNLTYPEDEYMLMANSLYTYFEPDAKWEWSRSIDKDSIIATLKKLKNKDDWAFLLKCFAAKHDNVTDSNMTLIEFLRKDDAGDRATYQKELDRIGAYNVLT